MGLLTSLILLGQRMKYWLRQLKKLYVTNIIRKILSHLTVSNHKKVFQEKRDFKRKGDEVVLDKFLLSL